MAQSKGMVMMIFCAVSLLLDRGVPIANAQPSGRQPLRRIEEQPGASPQLQPLRSIPRRVEGQSPRSGAQPGQPDLQRQIIVRPPQIRIRPVPSVWRLGVRVDESPRGLRIQEVSRNSAAHRFGLEVGDYLLDVMGYPVGFYRGFYYPLGETLNQVTPRDGWVNLLVWNRRTMAEEALWVQLERRPGVVVPSRGGNPSANQNQPF